MYVPNQFESFSQENPTSFSRNQVHLLFASTFKPTFGLNVFSVILKWLLPVFVLLLCSVQGWGQTTRTATSTGNWNSTSTWQGGTVPSANDPVIINAGVTVTVTTNAVCSSIQINNSTSNSTTRLNVNSNVTLTVGNGTGTVTIGSGAGMSNGNTSSTSLNVNGILNCGNISQSPATRASGNGGSGNTNLIINSTAIVTVTGNVAGTTVSGSNSTNGSASVTLSAGGTLKLTGNLTTTNVTANGTIEYNSSTPQSIRALTYNNLILSGSDTKTFNAATTISKNLSIANGVTVACGTFLHTAGSLTINGLGTAGGTWGGTSSGATYVNTTFFAANSGRITVSTDTRATPTVTPTVGAYTFDGSAQGPNAATNTGTGTSYTYSYIGTGSTTYAASSTRPTNAGTYTVTVTVAANGNFTSASSSATAFTISTSTLTVTASAQSKTYGGTAPTSGTLNTNYTITGLQGTDAVSGVTLGYSGTPAGNTATAAVGSYTITPSALTLSSGSLSNYTISYVTGTLTVSRATLTITAANQTVTYGTAAATVTGAGSYTATGFVNSETSSVIGGTASYTTTYTATTAAGTAGVTITPVVTALTATNYSFSAANGTITISKENSSITATGTTSYTYTGAAQGPTTASVTGSTGAVTYSYSGTGSTTYAASATRPTNAGTYAVIATVAADANFNSASSAALAFTINKATLTITAADQTVTYGTVAATVTGAGSYTATGFVNSETSSVIGGTASYTTTYTSTTAAGTAGVTITPVVSALTATNYSFSAANGAITITAAPLTITGITANNKEYDATATATISGTPVYNGLVNGESFAVSGSPVATFNNEDAGTNKTVTVSGYAAPNSNYSVSNVSLTASITAATLTYTATAASRQYGEANPSFTGNVTGFKGSDNVSNAMNGSLSFTSSALQFSNTGSYAINGTGLTPKKGNYVLVQAADNSSALTITSRPINVSGSRTYNGSASFTAAELTVSGTVNNDVVTVGGTAAVTDFRPGSYSSWSSNNLTVSNSNYTANGGTVSITINGLSQGVADYRTRASGNLNGSVIWEYDMGGGTWANATAAPGLNNSITVQSMHTVTQNIDFTVQAGKQLVLEAGNTGNGWIIGAGNTLTLTGTANFNNNPVLIQSNQTGTGSIGVIGNSGANLSGATNVVVQRHINAARKAWRMLTAPVTRSTANNSIFSNWQINTNYGATGIEISGIGGTGINGNGVTSGSTSMRTFANGQWVDVSNTKSRALYDTGNTIGYLVNVNGTYGDVNGTANNVVLNAQGALRQGNQTYTITSPVANRYYMVGNPYASPITHGNAGTEGSPAYGITMSNTTNTIWVYDPNLTGNLGRGGYVAFDRRFNTYNVVGRSSAGLSYNSGSNYTRIQSGQAFFVRASSNPSGNLTVSFTENSKEGGITNTPFRVNNNNTSEKIRVTLERMVGGTASTADGAVAFFYNNGNKQVNDMDGIKITNSVDNIMFRRDGVNLCFEHRPLVDQTDTLYLNMTSTAQTTYRLTVEGADFASGIGLAAVLQDLHLNTEIPLSINSATNYNFTITSASTSTGQRFRIVFRSVTALSVDFTNVKAYATANGNQVTWNTENESELTGYEVQRSSDGRNFKTVGTTAARNNQQSEYYQWLDAQPLSGDNFYRIKAATTSGREYYSGIVRVRSTTNGNGVSFYPNPVKKGGMITLEMNNMAKGRYQLALHNAAGLLVYNKVLDHTGGSAAQSLLLPGTLPSGTYVIELTDVTGMRIQSKITIQ